MEATPSSEPLSTTSGRSYPRLAPGGSTRRLMSGGETRQNPLPKGQFRDRAESERQRMTNGPRMVTYILNRPLNAQTMHIFRRRDCILLHTPLPLSGGYISHYIQYHAFNMLSHHSNGTGGAYWMASLKQVGETLTHMGGRHPQDHHKIIQLAALLLKGNGRSVNSFAMRSHWVSHPSNGTGGTAHWICTGKVQQEIKPTSVRANFVP